MATVGTDADLEISVVVPVYGCESCLVALHERITASLEPLGVPFEIVLVDDRSKQNDWNVIRRLASLDPRVNGVRLCRNFGQHQAIAAGMEHANAAWVVVMDCDLQDPPEEIPRLYRTAKEGFHAVFARRMNRKDGLTKRTGSRLFGWVHGLLGGFESDSSIGNFSIISRRVVAELRGFGERNRNYAMQVHWLGFSTAYVDVEHASRHSGETSYTFATLVRHALATVLTQSTRPLYVSTAVGFSLALGAATFAAYLFLRKLVYGVSVEGWTSVMVSLFFLFGVLFVNLGVFGLYLGNIFLDLKKRPLYVIEETTRLARGATTNSSRDVGELA